jgi:hypothetical protein
MNHKDYDNLQKFYKSATKIFVFTVVFSLILISIFLIKLNK